MTSNAAEDDWSQFHLTPEGWVEGSGSIGHTGEVEYRDVPVDTVRTVCFRTVQATSFSKEEKWYQIEFEGDDDAEIEQLVKEFGELPEQYKGWKKRNP